jgi:hypothetical protein
MHISWICLLNFIFILQLYHDGTLIFPHRPIPNERPLPEAISDNGSPVYEVDRILAQRGRGRNMRYLVLWKGYPLWESTWEPLVNVQSADQALKDFHRNADNTFQMDHIDAVSTKSLYTLSLLGIELTDTTTTQ